MAVDCESLSSLAAPRLQRGRIVTGRPVAASDLSPPSYFASASRLALALLVMQEGLSPFTHLKRNGRFQTSRPTGIRTNASSGASEYRRARLLDSAGSILTLRFLFATLPNPKRSRRAKLRCSRDFARNSFRFRNLWGFRFASY